MKVRELMTSDVEACCPTTDLASVAMSMWRRDCGIIPVVDEARRVLGVITDRDICMAVATRHCRPEELTARDVVTGKVFAVHPDDELRSVLDVMRTNRIRRLPVVDAEKRLQGIISINDVALHAHASGARTTAELSANDVLTAFQKICEHPLPAARPHVNEALATARA